MDLLIWCWTDVSYLLLSFRIFQSVSQGHCLILESFSNVLYGLRIRVILPLWIEFDSVPSLVFWATELHAAHCCCWDCRRWFPVCWFISWGYVCCFIFIFTLFPFAFYLFLLPTVHSDCIIFSLHSSQLSPTPFLCLIHCSSVSLKKRAGSLGIAWKVSLLFPSGLFFLM